MPKFKIEQKGRIFNCKAYSLQCFVCKKTHRKLKDLFVYSNSLILTINCTSNKRCGNLKSPIIVWKEKDQDKVYKETLKIEFPQ